MKKMIAIAVCVAASSLCAPGVFAQTSAPHAKTTARAAHRAHRYSVEERIRSLHRELKITPAEESQWGQVAQTMRDNAAQMKQMFEAQHGKRDSMSAIELLNNYSTMAQAHADGVKKVSDAFVPLYNSMPDAQKKVADRVFRTYRPYGKPGKHGGKWQHHGHPHHHAQHSGAATVNTPQTAPIRPARQAH